MGAGNKRVYRLFQTFTSAGGWCIVTLCVINATSTKMSYFCGPYIGLKSETSMKILRTSDVAWFYLTPENDSGTQVITNFNSS